MSLELIDSVRSILEKIEEQSGKKIKYIEKNDLAMSAKIKMAGRKSSEHLLLYKKDHTPSINYVIANQCGHILRILDAGEDTRFFPVANRRTMLSYMMETESEVDRLTPIFGADKIKKLAILWYEGAVFQVTKMPPDIQIDKWLYDNYPDLRSIQLKSLQRQLQNAVQGLSKDVRKIVPRKIYNVSNIMNFAFFKVLEDHFTLDFVAPYHRTIFLFEGSKLARMTEKEYINNHEGDIEMINKWAEHLDLTTWFQWKPFDEMPDDYIF